MKEALVAEREQNLLMKEAAVPAFDGNEYLFEEVVQEHVSEKVMEKIKGEFVKFFWIEGKIEYIITTTDYALVAVTGRPISRIVFRVPLKDKVFLPELRRAQSFDAKVRVDYFGFSYPPIIKSVKVVI